MAREALVFYSEFDDPQAWGSALGAELPDIDFRVAPQIGNPEDVRYVLAWKPPTGFFAALPEPRAGGQSWRRRRLPGRPH